MKISSATQLLPSTWYDELQEQVLGKMSILGKVLGKMSILGKVLGKMSILGKVLGKMSI